MEHRAPSSSPGPPHPRTSRSRLQPPPRPSTHCALTPEQNPGRFSADPASPQVLVLLDEADHAACRRSGLAWANYPLVSVDLALANPSGQRLAVDVELVVDPLDTSPFARSGLQSASRRSRDRPLLELYRVLPRAGMNLNLPQIQDLHHTRDNPVLSEFHPQWGRGGFLPVVHVLAHAGELWTDAGGARLLPR